VDVSPAKKQGESVNCWFNIGVPLAQAKLTNASSRIMPWNALADTRHDRLSHISKGSTASRCCRRRFLPAHPGEKVGLVGPNGSGKTTLFA